MSGNPHQLLLLAADSLNGLQAQLALSIGALTTMRDPLPSASEGPFRLAILGPDAQRIALATKVIEAGAPWRGRKNVWFTSAPLLGEKSGGIALLFPGLEQRFDPTVDDVAAHFGMPNPDLSRSDLSVREHSLSLLAVGNLLDAALRRIGVAPAAVAGHSIGEWNAMVSSGLVTSTALDAFTASLDPAVFELPNCVFAALGCGVDTASQAIADIEGVVISHNNCPHQSVICGEEESIALAVTRLHTLGVAARVLNFRSGFHSPFLEPYLPRVAGIAKVPFATAAVAIWSATTSQPFPVDEQQIRDLVIRHLLEPVEFHAMIENMYASGIRAFIQVGVGSVTGFIDDTLADREYLSVAANVSGQPGMQQLRRTAAALWVEGAQLQLDALFPQEQQVAVVH